MLAGIIALAFQHQTETGSISFDYTDLLQLELGGTTADVALRRFRTGLRHQGPALPLPHLAARRPRRGPDAGSVLLAGVLLKLGTYGFLRFNLPLFPDASVDLIRSSPPWR